MHKRVYKSGLNIPLTVTERRSESADHQSVVFERPKGFEYSSGHWIDLSFPGTDIPDLKTFSFASSPTEPEIIISFKNGVSKHKQLLQSVAPGDKMLIERYGGMYTFNPHRPSLMIAGGIGIAPLRSMIKEAADTGSSISIVLIYLNSTPEFAFRQDLESWRSGFPNLETMYINTHEQGRLTEKTLLDLVPDVSEREIFAAGPPSMAQATEALLARLGTAKQEIHIDSFDGY